MDGRCQMLIHILSKISYLANSIVHTADILFHRLCSTYPKTLVVPHYYHDDQLVKVAKFRKSGRVPAVVWR